MYAIIVRRSANPERRQETLERAASQFFPTLQQARGFAGFYLVAGDDGMNTAVTLWEDRAAAEAFQPQVEQWNTTLDELGNQFQSRTVGEVLRQLTPSR